jgi:DNA-binding CsgD family transcriptional regulator
MTLSEIAAQLSLSLITVSTTVLRRMCECREAHGCARAAARIMEKLGTHNDVETALYVVRHQLVNMAN